MGSPRRADALLRAGAWTWAVLGGALALVWVANVKPENRIPAIFVTALAVAAAVAAGMLSGRGAYRWAGACLVLSAGMPTGFAFIGNVVALVAGVVLLVGAGRWRHAR